MEPVTARAAIASSTRKCSSAPIDEGDDEDDEGLAADRAFSKHPGVVATVLRVAPTLGVLEPAVTVEGLACFVCRLPRQALIGSATEHDTTLHRAFDGGFNPVLEAGKRPRSEAQPQNWHDKSIITPISAYRCGMRL